MARRRLTRIEDRVIAFSMSFERDNLLSRGLGFEHLRELALRLARTVLRHGANLAYGGHWRAEDGNLTYDLLRLVRAEQQMGDPSSRRALGRLYNHLPWPYFLEITPVIEAEWINCCTIVRVDQSMAGLQAAEQVPDAEAQGSSARAQLNRALVLSRMRRLMMEEMKVEVPGDEPETIPPVTARVALGGKTAGYQGFMPGIFEEALVTLAAGRPMFVLGGFGGAAERLADAILGTGGRPPELEAEALARENPVLAEAATSLRLPADLPSPTAARDQLWAWIEAARRDLGSLNTGLDDAETRTLLRTRDVTTAVRLVRAGLDRRRDLPMRFLP